MTLGELLKNDNWTRKRLGRPELIDGEYYLTVRTPEKGIEGAQELHDVLLSARRVALRHTLEYLAKHYSSGDLNPFIAAGHVDSIEWFLDARPNSRILVLVKIDRAELDVAFPKQKTYAEEKEADEIIKFTLPGIRDLVSRIITRLQGIQRDIGEFQGKVLGFSAEREINLLREFPNAYIKLLSEHNLQEEEGSIETHVTTVFEPLRVFFRAETLIRLSRGYIVFQGERAIRSRRTMSLIYNVMGDEEKFFDPNTPWTVLLAEFFVPPISIKPALKKAEKNFKKNSNDFVDRVFPKSSRKKVKSIFDKAEEEGVLTTDFKAGFRERREKETEFVGDSSFVGLEYKPPKMSTLEDFYLELLHQIDLTVMLEIAIDCIPEFDFDFDLPTFKFPTFNIPKLPVFDYLLIIRLDFERILKEVLKKILELIISILIHIIIDFCEDRKLPGGKNPDYGSIDIRDIRRASGEADPDMPEIPEALDDLGKGTPPGNDDILDFIDDLFDGLTPNQICNLLRGMPSPDVVEMIQELLEEDKYAPLKEFFEDEDSVIEFFKNLGEIIGAATILRLCEIEDSEMPDPCAAQESFEQVQRRLYERKRQRGEPIPEEYEDEMIERSKELRQKLADILNELVKNPNIFDQVKDEVADSMNSFSPSESLPDGKKLASEEIVDGIFDSSFVQLEPALAGYWGEVQESFLDGLLGLSVVDKMEEFKNRLGSFSGSPQHTFLAQEMSVSPFFSNGLPTIGKAWDVPLVSLGLTEVKERCARVARYDLSYIQNGGGGLENEIKDSLFEVIVRTVVADYSNSVRAITLIFPTVDVLESLRGNIRADINNRLSLQRGLIVDYDDKLESYISDAISSLSSLNNSQQPPLYSFSQWAVDKGGLEDYESIIPELANYTRTSFIGEFSGSLTNLQENKIVSFGRYFDSAIEFMIMQLDGVIKAGR